MGWFSDMNIKHTQADSFMANQMFQYCLTPLLTSLHDLEVCPLAGLSEHQDFEFDTNKCSILIILQIDFFIFFKKKNKALHM